MRAVRVGMALVLACAVAVGVSVRATVETQSMSDADYDTLMKAVGAANGAMRKSMATDPASASAEAKKLAEHFKTVETFWKGRNAADGVEWAKAATTHALEIDKALTAKNMESANDRAKQLGAQCQGCHEKYREKTTDGFIIKKP